MSKDSKLVTVISIIIVVALVVVAGLFIRNSISGNSDNSEQRDIANTEAQAGSSKSNPIIIPNDDFSLSGEAFASKYTGKFIKFDGLLQGTGSIKNAKNPHTTLLHGDDFKNGSFADGSLFWIVAGNSTFSDDLKEFATDNNSPYEKNEYPKIQVSARVTQFDEVNNVVQLEPIGNVDGKSPSVTSR